MRELLSLSTVKTLFVITGVLAACCLAVASVVLVFQVRDQDRELDCRAEDAARLDVLRSEVALELSRGLVYVVQEDDEALALTVARLEDLQRELDAATEQRRTTVERCQ